MTRRRVSNPLALAVLSCLMEQPMHPYEMSRTMRERAKEGSIKLNYGSLYSVVAKLQQHGLIEAVETVHEGNRPERTIYRITGEGRTEFEDWLAELLSTPVKEFTQFEAGLSLIAGLPCDDVVVLLRMRRRAIEQQLEAFETGRRQMREHGLPRLLNLEWEYVEAMQRAELTWLDGLLCEIEDGTLEGLEIWRQLHERSTPPDQPVPATEPRSASEGGEPGDRPEPSSG